MNTIDNENITDSSSRLPFIYGMKGIAALSVFLCHIIAVFLPGFRFYNNENITTIEKVWLETPLNAFTNGNTPVQFFFVISGFLIARNKNKLGGLSVLKKILKLIPIAWVSILFSFLLMKLGLMHNAEAAKMNSTLDFVSSFNNFEPTVTSLLKDFFLVFYSGSLYNSPLWTLGVECLGSVIILILSFYLENVQDPLLVLFVLLFLPGAETIWPFLFGCAVWFIIKRYSTICKNTLLRTICYVFGIYFSTGQENFLGIYQPIKWITSKHIGSARAFGIAILFIALFQSNTCMRFFSNKVLVFLGKISSFFYAFHWPIILSLGCGLYILLKDFNYYFAFIIIFGMCLVCTILLSEGVTKVMNMITYMISGKKKIEKTK